MIRRLGHGLLCALAGAIAMALVQTALGDSHPRQPWNHPPHSAIELHIGKDARAATQAKLRAKCRPTYDVQYVPYEAMPVGLGPWSRR